ncbi:MAG: hypothetical protein KAS04_07045 [Candidatus Aenigmarchaeota archaeon]|nr:hypothetical protein [Candidatus Aenigmarchaeota archaeon]
MAGYFVSAHYFKQPSKLICQRLFTRGAKLILIYIILNLIFIYIVNKNIDLGIITRSDNPIKNILIGDPSRVIYDILYSIGIVLTIGAALSVIHIRVSSKHQRYTLTVLASALLIILFNKSVLILSGITGIIVGLPYTRNFLNKIYNNKTTVIASYLLGLLLAIFIDNIKEEAIIYILGIIMLFFSLKHTYKYLKEYIDKSEIIRLLSRHSLFIYLFHVPLLIITTKLFLKNVPTIDPSFLFIILLLLISYSSIIVTQRIEIANKHKNVFNTVYKSIFN